MIHEIGVCREETFRKNNEGTGKAIDLDRFDRYYFHMFLWNDEACELAGAYRVGIGRDILSKYGLRGFYSDLFFHFKDGMAPLLTDCIELGRSFIVEKYQTVLNTLKLLVNMGLSRVLGKFPQMKYFIGPASISSGYSPMFGSLMVEYFRQTKLNETSDRLTVRSCLAGDFPKTQFFYPVEVKDLLSDVHRDHCLKIYSPQI